MTFLTCMLISRENNHTGHNMLVISRRYENLGYYTTDMMKLRTERVKYAVINSQHKTDLTLQSSLHKTYWTNTKIFP